MRSAVLTLVAACGFHPGAAPPGDGEIGDAPPRYDAPIPDATPLVDARTCPDAPSGCTTFQCAGSTSCFYICGTGPGGAGRRMWSEARDGCVSRGLGCLATIDSAAENTCIATNVTPVFPDLVWFGWVQGPGAEPSGGWDWQCGTSSFVAPNWGLGTPSEPNNGGPGGNEDCGALAADGAWIDGGCTTQLRYLCELP